MYEYQASVNKVHDGDTLRLNIDLGFNIHNENIDVRLFGVDAPELHRPDKLGEKARDSLKQWLVIHPGPYVMTSVKDKTEKFGRYLIKSFKSKDGHELITDQKNAGYLKAYTGEGPKPEWTPI